MNGTAQAIRYRRDILLLSCFDIILYSTCHYIIICCIAWCNRPQADNIMAFRRLCSII